jgi:hypothetical protein
VRNDHYNIRGVARQSRMQPLVALPPPRLSASHPLIPRLHPLHLPPTPNLSLFLCVQTSPAWAIERLVSEHLMPHLPLLARSDPNDFRNYKLYTPEVGHSEYSHSEYSHSE